VKDLLAYLRVVLNGRDEIALRRVLNYPARQIGEAALEKIENAANMNKKTLYDAVCDAGSLGLFAGAADGCGTFVSIINDARTALASGQPSVQIARALAETVGLHRDILEGSPSNAQSARRWGNVESLFRVFERHDARMADNRARPSSAT